MKAIHRQIAYGVTLWLAAAISGEASPADDQHEHEPADAAWARENGDFSLSFLKGAVSLQADAARLGDILDALAIRSGIILSVGQSAAAKSIDINFENLPLRVAMERLLADVSYRIWMLGAADDFDRWIVSVYESNSAASPPTAFVSVRQRIEDLGPEAFPPGVYKELMSLVSGAAKGRKPIPEDEKRQAIDQFMRRFLLELESDSEAAAKIHEFLHQRNRSASQKFASEPSLSPP